MEWANHLPTGGFDLPGSAGMVGVAKNGLSSGYGHGLPLLVYPNGRLSAH